MSKVNIKIYTKRDVSRNDASSKVTAYHFTPGPYAKDVVIQIDKNEVQGKVWFDAKIISSKGTTSETGFDTLEEAKKAAEEAAYNKHYIVSRSDSAQSGWKLVKTESYKGKTIEVFALSLVTGRYLSAAVNGAPVKRGPMQSEADAIRLAKEEIDKNKI